MTKVFDKLEFDVLDEYNSYWGGRDYSTYLIKLSYNEKSYRFEYHDNYFRYDYEEVLRDILNDKRAYDLNSNIEDFASEFGYDEDSEGCEECFEGCRKTSEALEEMFTDDELEQLEEELDV